MKLSFDQICAATTGAVNITREKDGLIYFHRMHPAQLDAAMARHENYYIRGRSNTGVKLTFRTDSTSLFLDLSASRGTMSYFAADILVNGRLIGSVDNFTQFEPLPQFHTQLQYPFGDFSGRFDLGEGEKTVRVHLSWGPVTMLRELSLDDGASFIPVIPDKKILFYGDSITQGMDCLHPSQTYSARLADALGMAEYNKAIAGTTSFPEMTAVREEFTPNVIVVAYGTNDWSLTDRDTFTKSYRAMLDNIQTHYPGVPVFALTPIARRQMNEFRTMGAFCKVASLIREIAADFAHVTVIDCTHFVPIGCQYFGDGNLHPNARGFDCFFRGVWKAMQAALENKEDNL